MILIEMNEKLVDTQQHPHFSAKCPLTGKQVVANDRKYVRILDDEVVWWYCPGGSLIIT